MHAVIKTVIVGRGFAFARINGEHRDVFIHATLLTDAGFVFDERLIGERLDVVADENDGRLRATSISQIDWSVLR
jgi:cold shock CspA family protein